MLITMSGISEQLGNTDWAEGRLYMTYTYNAFAMIVTSVFVLFSLTGFTFSSVVCVLFATYIIGNIVIDFHLKLDSLQKQ